MTVSLAQYRGEIGLFYNRSFAPDLCYMFSITDFMFLFIKILPILLLGLALLISLLLRNFSDFLRLQSQSKHFKENPGPKLNSSQKISIYHWNLNSIAVHNFIKVSLLIA